MINYKYFHINDYYENKNNPLLFSNKNINNLSTNDPTNKSNNLTNRTIK